MRGFINNLKQIKIMNLSSISEKFQNFFKLPLKQRLLIEKQIIKNVMRIGIVTITILIATSVQLLFASPLKSQPIDEVDIKIGLHNETLVQAFQKIEAQSPFHFMYRNDEVKNIRNLNFPVNKKSVEEFLKIILAKTSLTYRQINDQILIMPAKNWNIDPASNDGTDMALKEESEFIYNPTANTVHGKVTNSKGEPLVGVSVEVKGTNNGTSTDGGGNYSINVPENGILVFSFIGFKTKEVAVNNQIIINEKLQEANTALNEVVVTALGIKRESRSLTYSTQSVSTKELTETRELNVVNSLAGKVAGMSINSSGTGVGASARVVLRGNRSISGDSQPLYVVDGVQIMGDPSNLDLDNIASINVLKGPNAAALYGSAAQNGVIIIETKSGQNNGLNISLNNTYITMDPVLSIPFQNVYGQGNGGIYQKTSESAWGPAMQGQMVDNWVLDPQLAGTKYALTPQPNNKIDIYQKGANFASNLFVSMGSEKIKTTFSYTYTNAKGIVPGNELHRNNLSLRVIDKISKKLTLDSKIDYVQQLIKNQLSEGAYNFNPNMQIYSMPSNINLSDASHYAFNGPTGYPLQNYWSPASTLGENPFWVLNNIPNKFTSERVIAMSSLSYDFTDALKLMVRTSYDGASGTQEEELHNNTFVRALDGRYTFGKTNAYLLNGDFLASYKHDFAHDITASVNAGGSVLERRNNSVSSNTGSSMIIPNFFTLSNTNLPVTTNDPGLSSDIQSLYAFANIGWKNALFLDVTARNDWSSTLPANSRSYFYPSFGLSAILNDLIPSFPKVISYAKIRASWAEVGNSAPPYMLDRTASFRAGGNFGFLRLNSILPNPNLLPEKTKSAELGLDIRFFSGRLGLNLTAYKTNTLNQLFTISMPVGSGEAQFFTNGGNVQNKGIEFILTGTPVQTKLFNWETTVNFAVNRSMVLKISDDRPSIVIGNDPYVRQFEVQQGQPYGQIYSKGWVRDSLGRVIIGTNGMPKITPGRTVLVANFNPDWTGSISNSFTFKNITLSFLIEHRQGGSVVSMTNAMLDGSGLTARTLQGRDGGLIFGQNFFSNEISVTADGSHNTIPINAETFWQGVGGRNTPVGEAFVSSATNTRFRELTLGYTIPHKMLGNLPVNTIQISIVGRNLFYIHRASPDLDTDFMVGTTPDSEGFQAFAPPTTRSIGLNLKINFK